MIWRRKIARLMVRRQGSHGERFFSPWAGPRIGREEQAHGELKVQFAVATTLLAVEFFRNRNHKKEQKKWR